MSFDLIRQLLRDVGPMTASEIRLLTKSVMTHSNVSKALTSMRQAGHPDFRVHIQGYVREDGVGRHYLRAVYAAGPGREPPRPPPLTCVERNRRRKAKAALPHGPSSVFDLARFL